jgi:hypothetical protein
MPAYPATHSYASSLSNPCPSGTGIGYGDFNGTIFVICDPTFNNNHNYAPDILAIGLGVGLGVGLPAIIAAVWLLVFLTGCSCYRNKYALPTIHQPKLDPKYIVVKELSPKLLDQFRNGNLTNELKKKLFEIKDKSGRPLVEYSNYAIECNQLELAHWILRVNYTTLQDEGIV